MDPARLKKIPVFADVDDEELRHIANLAAEVSVPDGKELVREGDYSYDVLVDRGGHGERRDATASTSPTSAPGDVVGEMGVLERAQRNATGPRDRRRCAWPR